MRRREFIAGLGSAAAWPVVARAQRRDAIKHIVWTGHTVRTVEGHAYYGAAGLTESGYYRAAEVQVYGSDELWRWQGERHADKADAIASAESGSAMARIADLPASPDEIKSVRIKRYAWIGHNSFIMKGVTVGEGAIIGVNSVVLNDIPDYSVAIGNPARVIVKNINRTGAAATASLATCGLTTSGWPPRTWPRRRGWPPWRKLTPGSACAGRRGGPWSRSASPETRA